MTSIDISEKEKDIFNSLVTHPLQSFEWGEFRKKTGVNVLRKGFLQKQNIHNVFQLTIHKIPNTPYTVGYLPKGDIPTIEIINELFQVGKRQKIIFIQLEPNEINSESSLKKISGLRLAPSFHPLFTKYTFVLDLKASEDELMKNMHPKTRYNIKIATRYGVEIQEDNSEEAFHTYLSLTKETMKRQGFYAHTSEYHRLMWETLKPKSRKINTNELTAHLFLAKYKGVPLVAWILFVFHDTLYYPYGASSTEYREVMASNKMMWDAIRYGKTLGLTRFDMWGALGPNPKQNDPWYGFHKFKQGYGPKLTESIGSFDVIVNPILYQGYKVADKIRWGLLRMKAR